MKNNTINQKKLQEVYEGGKRKIPLEISIDVKAEFLELAISSGFRVIRALFEEDVDTLCGPCYQHQEVRNAFHWGNTKGEIILGGQKVQIERPRVREKNKQELSLLSYEHLKDKDPLKERVLNQILIRVSTRRYGDSLETNIHSIVSRATSKSTISGCFVAMTTKRFIEWLSRPLKELDICILYIDGVIFGKHTIVVAVGVNQRGYKACFRSI
ncbi:MAG: transposase [bacterium]